MTARHTLAEYERIRAKCYHPTGTFVPLPAHELNQSLLPRFAEMVARFPDHLAVQDGERSLTYRQLDAAANRVANALVAATGAEPVAIALLFGQELEWIVATLGVWKAGKFWVALDLRHPRARLAAILDDAQTPLILTSIHHRDLAMTLAGVGADAVDEQREWLTVEALLADYPADAPKVTVTSESYAYLVYTSGSTGRPKGVIENHDNILHMVAERGNLVHPSSADRIGLLLPPAAGGAVYNIVLTLWYGAAIMLFDFAEQGLTRYEDWLLAEGITGMHAGVVLRTWLPTLDGSRTFPTLRFLLLGAAPVYRDHVTAFQRYFGGQCVLVNPYSSAEVRAVALFAMDATTVLDSQIIPVGFVAPWVTVEIWGEDELPVAAGVTGEVVIFTERMTPGYWQQPERTAEVFGVDARGRRYYRSGDIGRMDADGCLWILGRKDRQVKIRGHRVEPAEVEVELLNVEGVREAAIIVHGARDDEKYLAAYVTLDPACTLSEAGLREAIAARLPNYMVPREVTVLAELPRNPYGKVDRPALSQRMDRTVHANTDAHTDDNTEESLNNYQQATRVRRAEQVYATRIADGAQLFATEGRSIPFAATTRDQTLLHRWEVMVERYAARPALEEASRTLTYAEVNVMANRIAHALLARHLPQDVAVGLLFEIEGDMPIGMLAAWKAGHFIAWFEPRQPLARNQLIVEDSGARVVVTNRIHADLARQLWPDDAVIVVEELAAELPTTNPPNILEPSHYAYLIYTSGSTGTPKGTLESQGNLVHLMAKRETLFQFSPEDRVAFLLYGVGIIFSLAAAWMYGGCFLPFDAKNEGLTRFSKWLFDCRITFVIGGSDVRTWLLTLDGSQQFPVLRFLGLSTGPTFREHLEAYQRYLPDHCAFANLYSATEFRIGALAFLDRQTQVANRALPAGYSLDPGTVEIWDEQGHALGSDATGEIVVISPYVALGYWKSPALTAHKFGEDAQGRRYFRTGDLGRIDAEGCLWMLGRSDGFVKIRGNRVATAEVEAALLELPAVREAAVIEHGTADGELVLRGFVAADSPVTSSELRRQLAAHLPDYMIPASIAVLDVLPHNANGKVDRPALRTLLAGTDKNIEHPLGNSHMTLDIAPSTDRPVDDPMAQQAKIAAKSYHPTGEYLPITPAEAELSPLHRWEKIVARYPENTAIEEDDRVVNYAELNARMNRLAHAILAREIPKDVPVALLFDVEGDYPMSTLAVWKAGNFFVWLDPTQPLARNQLIVDDSSAPVVVTNRRHANIAHQLWPDEAVIVIEELAADLPTYNPPITVDGASPAYLLYTSGSTGKPKGVLELQRNLMMMMMMRQEVLHFSTHDRIALLVLASTWSFSTLSALLYGGCLLPFQAKEAGFARFSQWLIDKGITLAYGGSILRSWLLTLDGSQQFPALRGLTLGAGPSYREHVQAFQRYLSDASVLYFTYSATEVRCCTSVLIDKQTRHATRLVPAGFPPQGSAVEIWGDNNQPLPVGETGEIIAITPYTASHYWKSPELSAQKLGVDTQGRRYYRMGDLGRMDEQGCLWILGRKDRQVKIRGNRVETAEVEVSLLELPAVQEAAVIDIGETDETRELLAFVTVETQVAGSELRKQLATRLPNYMVPSMIAVLEELPRNANGKIARPLLRDMAKAFSTTMRAPQQAVDEAQTETEKQVASMVSELLDGHVLGLHDDFFDQGGHSLLAARLMLQVFRTFGVDLAPRDFFIEPTVAALAARIDSALAQQAPKSASTPRTATPQGIEAVQVLRGAPNNLPIFHCLGWNGSEEMIFRYQEMIRRMGKEWPLYALVASGTSEPAALFKTMDELVVAALSAIRQVQPHGPYLLFGECLGGKLAFELARKLEQEVEAVGLLVMLDTPFRPKWAEVSTAKGLIPRFKLYIKHWSERVEHHWPRLANMGWRRGIPYVMARITALLPHALYPHSTFRPRMLAHKRYAKLMLTYVASEAYLEPTVALFTRDNQHHHASWTALLPQLETTFVDRRHQDYLSEAGDEVAAVLHAALTSTKAVPPTES